MKTFLARSGGWLAGLCLLAGVRAETSLSLAGRWRYALDRADVGLAEAWFRHSLPGTLRLPGSLPGQGIGDPISTNTPWVGGIVDRTWFTAPEYARYREPGRVKVPFWLQPERYYRGVAWYQRLIEIPAAWAGRRVVLVLERPHWETRVWLNDRCLGTNDSLSTPHEYPLGVGLAPGRYRLTVRVDNRLVVDIGVNSHSVSDHTQGNWNGIVGRLELRATPPVWIEDLQVFPHAADRAATVRMRLGNATGSAGTGRLRLRCAPESGATRGGFAAEHPVRWTVSGGSLEFTHALGGEAALWDEFHPALYRLTAELDAGEAGPPAEAVTAFGLREFAVAGTQFTLNGRPVFLRGTLECSIFPRTGHPPTDVASWRRVMQAAQAHGLNHLRFHSHCPPEAAFRAADELGVYLHVECASWPNQSTTLGDGRPVDAWLYREAERILRAYGNHPSFVMLLAGNEPGGARHAEYLRHWVPHFRALDPRRLYSGGAGWPQIPENQFHVAPDPRIQAWGAGLKSRINARPPETVTDYRDYVAARTVPVVSHEMGQWCVYPNFAERRKYTGYLKPRNFEIFRDSLRAGGMLGQARDFLYASGRLQTLCYKEEIEAALRTPGLGGFQLLDLHDFPGQGTALVGVLDAFWEPKGYVSAAEFRRFCGPTVPLARLPKRVFTADETLTADLEVAHFGPAPLPEVTPVFQLVGDDGRAYHPGRLAARTVPLGNGLRLGRIALDLHPLPAPARYRLVVGLETAPGAGADPSRAAGPRFENDWDVWVYPPDVGTEVPPGVTVVHELDASAVAALEAGGKVLWLVPPARVAPDPRRGPVALGFSSIFWNTAWTGRQAPHTLGILCDPKHPLLAGFPTDAHSNWQWWYLVTRAGAMILDALPHALRPAVQVIDDWFTNRRLGLVFEARVGRGRLLVCSVDLENDLAADPVRRQFRRSLLDYLAGPHFRPRTPVMLDQLRRLVAPPPGATVAR